MGGMMLETHLRVPWRPHPLILVPQDIFNAVREQEELEVKASRDTPTAQRPMRGGLSAGGGIVRR